MQPTETIHVQLPKDVVTSLNEAVASGQYHTESEIVYVALLEWRRRREAAIHELRALVDEGIASGKAEPFTLEELLAEVRRKRAS